MDDGDRCLVVAAAPGNEEWSEGKSKRTLLLFLAHDMCIDSVETHANLHMNINYFSAKKANFIQEYSKLFKINKN